ncbi:MAG TPA: AlpA family transcriptional regulator [Lysobacter sp.]
MSNMQPAAPVFLLRLPEVISRVGLKKTAIYARIAAGTFPRPVTDGGVSRWVEAEIDAWIGQLIAKRDAGGKGA